MNGESGSSENSSAFSQFSFALLTVLEALFECDFVFLTSELSCFLNFFILLDLTFFLTPCWGAIILSVNVSSITFSIGVSKLVLKVGSSSLLDFCFDFLFIFAVSGVDFNLDSSLSLHESNSLVSRDPIS